MTLKGFGMAVKGIDDMAFRTLSYGVYIVSALDGGRPVGCVVNTLVQLTSDPVRVSLAINKENYTSGAVLKSGRFEASVVAESASMELIGLFGFQSSAQVDKFADVAHAFDSEGIPYVSESAIAHIGARVIETLDVGTHYLIVGEVECAEVLSEGRAMTYEYYHSVKGGKTPPKASSYNPAADAAQDKQHEQEEPKAASGSGSPRIGWRCTICGYVIEADELPEDFTCPMCGMGRDVFERIEL